MSNQIVVKETKAEQDQNLYEMATDLWMAVHNEFPKLTDGNLFWTVRGSIISLKVQGSLEVKGMQFYGFPLSESYTTMRTRVLRAAANCFDFSA